MVLHHKCFANDVSVDFIGLGLANVIFSHRGSLDRVEHTHFVERSNKISDKVVAVVPVDSRPMMRLFLSKESGLEISSWKPSPLFVN